MIVYTFPAIVPMLLAIGAYYLFGLFLDDINAFGVAAMIGSAVSALMELGGIRGTVFFVPVGVWLGAGALQAAFQLVSFNAISFDTEPGIGIMIMAVIATLLGLVSLAGMFLSGGSDEEDDPTDHYVHD